MAFKFVQATIYGLSREDSANKQTSYKSYTKKPQFHFYYFTILLSFRRLKIIYEFLKATAKQKYLNDPQIWLKFGATSGIFSCLEQ